MIAAMIVARFPAKLSRYKPAVSDKAHDEFDRMLERLRVERENVVDMETKLREEKERRKRLNSAMKLIRGRTRGSLWRALELDFCATPSF